MSDFNPKFLVDNDSLSGNLFPRSIKVLVIGDVMLDRYICGKYERMSPEAPVPVVDFENEYARPGGAANVALNLKNLGAEVALCGICGKDKSGKLITAQMIGNGVDVEGVIFSESRNSTEKIRILGNGKQLLRVDKEHTDLLNQQEVEEMISAVAYKLDSFGPEVVIFQDYNKGLLNKTTIDKMLTLCRKKGVFTAVDPKFENFYQYQGVDFFKPNLNEFATALGRDLNATIEELKSGAYEFADKMDVGILMVTLGEKGIFVSNADGQFIRPAVETEIEDVSGAGDTVLAVATLGLCAGMELSRITELCNFAAAEVCSKAGVVSIRENQLIERMRTFLTSGESASG
ncbi:MAG: hypothetical protein EA411_11840 [Saprospirales bacterium]|nr:MAG: hypothetical protein EA411_11840 [Saprospirales bacterium]